MGMLLLALRGETGRLLEIKSRPRGSQRGCKREHRPGRPYNEGPGLQLASWQEALGSDLTLILVTRRGWPDRAQIMKGPAIRAPTSAALKWWGMPLPAPEGVGWWWRWAQGCWPVPAAANFRTALPPSPQWETKRKEGNSEDGRKESFQEHHRKVWGEGLLWAKSPRPLFRRASYNKAP